MDILSKYRKHRIDTFTLNPFKIVFNRLTIIFIRMANIYKQNQNVIFKNICNTFAIRLITFVNRLNTFANGLSECVNMKYCKHTHHSPDANAANDSRRFRPNKIGGTFEMVTIE